MTRLEHKEKMYTLVKQWRESGQSQASFIKEHQINLHTFRYWINKYNNGQQDAPDGFISLDHVSSSGDICIRYPNGVELYVPMHAPYTTLQKLVKL